MIVWCHHRVRVPSGKLVPVPLDACPACDDDERMMGVCSCLPSIGRIGTDTPPEPEPDQPTKRDAATLAIIVADMEACPHDTCGVCRLRSQWLLESQVEGDYDPFEVKPS